MTARKGNVEVRLSIRKEVLKAYKEYCRAEGVVMSKRIEKFFVAELEKSKPRRSIRLKQ